MAAGPQYNLPTTVGGGVANFKAFQSRLASTAPANGGRVKLTQSHLEGPPSYTLTREPASFERPIDQWHMLSGCAASNRH